MVFTKRQQRGDNEEGGDVFPRGTAALARVYVCVPWRQVMGMRTGCRRCVKGEARNNIYIKF